MRRQAQGISVGASKVSDYEPTASGSNDGWLAFAKLEGAIVAGVRVRERHPAGDVLLDRHSRWESSLESF